MKERYDIITWGRIFVFCLIRVWGIGIHITVEWMGVWLYIHVGPIIVDIQVWEWKE